MIRYYFPRLVSATWRQRKLQEYMFAIVIALLCTVVVVVYYSCPVHCGIHCGYTLWLYTVASACIGTYLCLVAICRVLCTT